MRRGSTPTFSFRLPAETSRFAEIGVIFTQNGKTVLAVDRSRFLAESTEISFVMTKEETLAFLPNEAAELQLSLTDVDGNIWVSDIRTCTVRKKYPEDLI